MHCISLIGVAGADLSTSGKILVKADGTDSEKLVVQADDTSVETAGILLGGKNTDDTEVQYVFSGFTTGIASAALEPFDELMAATGGKLAKATTGKVVVGKYMPATNRDAAANDEIRVYLYDLKDRLLA